LLGHSCALKQFWSPPWLTVLLRALTTSWIGLERERHFAHGPDSDLSRSKINNRSGDREARNRARTVALGCPREVSGRHQINLEAHGSETISGNLGTV
jgi:hypothetical protein